MSIRKASLELLLIEDASHKAREVLSYSAIAPSLADRQERLLAPPDQRLPGRPAKPELVPPAKVPKRGLHDRVGQAALIHALAHIELNAINLALDIVWRFADLPAAFYTAWFEVAQDEARHFSLLNAHLQKLGYIYGDFPAHNALWEMAERTQSDLLARLALVPRTLEARGLDASPMVRDKLRQFGDEAGAQIVQTILDDEVHHVGLGNQWFKQLCAERSLDPLSVFRELAARHRAPRLQPPFNLTARRRAGFSEEEIEQLLKSA